MFNNLNGHCDGSKRKSMKTALVLGGGGARGLAHIGVLKVLESQGFKPDLIVGCSIGAIIGGMYAQNPNIDSLEKRVKKFFESKEYENLNIGILEKHYNHVTGNEFLHHLARNLKRRVLLNLVVSRKAILKGDRLAEAVNFLIGKGDMSHTRIPFACIATDLVSGQPVLFTNGDIRMAIKASSTIPGYLPPVYCDSKVLVDGAVTYHLPTKFARSLGSRYIIAVDVKQPLQPQSDFRNVLDIVLRANNVTSSILSKETLNEADITITPQLKDQMWYEFRQINQLIKAGEEAVYQHLSLIQELVGKKRGSFLKKILKRLPHFATF